MSHSLHNLLAWLLLIVFSVLVGMVLPDILLFGARIFPALLPPVLTGSCLSRLESTACPLLRLARSRAANPLLWPVVWTVYPVCLPLCLLYSCTLLAGIPFVLAPGFLAGYSASCCHLSPLPPLSFAALTALSLPTAGQSRPLSSAIHASIRPFPSRQRFGLSAV